MTTPTEPTGPAYPDLVSQILHDYPHLAATDDPDTLLYWMTHGGQHHEYAQAP